RVVSSRALMIGMVCEPQTMEFGSKFAKASLDKSSGYSDIVTFRHPIFRLSDVPTKIYSFRFIGGKEQRIKEQGISPRNIKGKDDQKRWLP
ncbi:MAG: hypothetical protein RLQ12_02900, partial [Cyclobacteriaceae bacterium]